MKRWPSRPRVGFLRRTVLAAIGVEATVFDSQPFNRFSADDVRFYDFVHICQRHASVPHGFGIHNDIWPMLALIQTTGLIGAHSSLQSTLGELLLEELLQFGLACGITASTRMSRRTHISAHKNMALKLRHGNIVAGIATCSAKRVTKLIFQRHEQFVSAAKSCNTLDLAIAVWDIHDRAKAINRMASAREIPHSAFAGRRRCLLREVRLRFGTMRRR